MASLSVCMIVKDEEQLLPPLLESLKPFADELVVVDTGSSDSTVSIAKDSGALVSYFEWCDDFSAARNESLIRATKEWIFMLDADQKIAEADLIKIPTLIQGPAQVYSFEERHYGKLFTVRGMKPLQGEFPDLEVGVGYRSERVLPLFPNDPSIRYSKRIHESIEESVKEGARFPITESGLVLHHYGHFYEDRQKARAALYERLSTLKYEEHRDDWQAVYELGVQFYHNGKFHEAREYLERARELKPNHSVTWSNLGAAYFRLGEAAEARALLVEAMNRFPTSADVYSNAGVVLLRLNDLQGAEDACRHALSLNPTLLPAHRTLIKSLLSQGKSETAKNSLRDALSLYPEDAQLKKLFLSIS